MKKIYLVIILIISLILIGFICLNTGLFNTLMANENTFNDMGIRSNSSDEWLILHNVTKTITDNGTILSSTSDSGAYANKPSTSMSWDDTFEWSSPFTIEFNLISWNGKPSMRIVDADHDAGKSFGELGIRNGSHIKIISKDDSIEYIINGNSTYKTSCPSFKNAQIGFRLINSTIEYKNFKIY